MKAGWETKSLADTCKMYQPKTISGKEMKIDGAYPVFGANGIIGRYDQFNHAEPQLLITCRGATCGSVNVSLPNSWITGNAMVVRPKDDSIDLRYLEYYFRGGIDISLAITGAAQPQITRTNLDPLTIQYPTSLDEQRRIVAVLDKAFAGIATATANAQKNLTNARALFPTVVEEVLSRAANWKTMTLEQAADEACSLSYGIVQPGEEISEGLPIVRPTDLRHKFIGLGPLKRINPVLANSYRRTTLRGDDLLLCVRGTTGIISIATPELAGANVTRGIVPIRFNSALLSQELGYFLLRSASAQEQIKAATYGTALMQINIRDLKKLKIRIPARVEQQAIASLLNAAQDAVEQLCLNYSTKLEKLANLKQSLLQKAFAGELT